MTMLPRIAIEQLQTTPAASNFVIIAFDGSRSNTEAVDLELRFLGYSFTGTYLVIDSPIGLLGRDILRNFPILLDGPRQQWSVPTP